ncbi:MAG: cyclic nucleotide-binding domain-containing protein [Rhodospirillaceae bacterium]|nr:MAG: cyclic nucleotide-binding domain-containing protein [Rhodospirillaceae bacterium]
MLAGTLDPSTDWFQSTISAYRKALRLLTGPLERRLGLLNRSLGLALQAAAERGDDPELLERAVETYRSACLALNREQAPKEWGVLQARIGGLLYRLHMRTDKIELLKESLTAFQGALQVIARAEEPFRWADVMHNLSQSLQVYGDHIKSVEVLQL